MKRLRMILSALIIFAVVGSALAFRAAQEPDLLICNVATWKCEAQPPGYFYSSVPKGPSVSPEFEVYDGVIGDPCKEDNDPCQKYEGPVYEND